MTASAQSEAKRGRLTAVTVCPRASVDRFEEALVADRPRPLPNLPDLRLAIEFVVTNRREENELGFADQILVRHEADAGRAVAAVGGVVAVVAHHEIMARRYDEFLGVVERPL